MTDSFWKKKAFAGDSDHVGVETLLLRIKKNKQIQMQYYLYLLNI